MTYRPQQLPFVLKVTSSHTVDWYQDNNTLTTAAATSTRRNFNDGSVTILSEEQKRQWILEEIQRQDIEDDGRPLQVRALTVPGSCIDDIS